MGFSTSKFYNRSRAPKESTGAGLNELKRDVKLSRILWGWVRGGDFSKIDAFFKGRGES